MNSGLLLAHSLVTPIHRVTKVARRVFGAAETLQEWYLLWQSFMPMVYKAAVNTSLALPAYRESRLHVLLRYGNISLLHLNLNFPGSQNHRRSVCFICLGDFYPLLFLKILLACCLGKRRFWITPGTDSRLPGRKEDAARCFLGCWLADRKARTSLQ